MSEWHCGGVVERDVVELGVVERGVVERGVAERGMVLQPSHSSASHLASRYIILVPYTNLPLASVVRIQCCFPTILLYKLPLPTPLLPFYSLKAPPSNCPELVEYSSFLNLILLTASLPLPSPCPRPPLTPSFP